MGRISEGAGGSPGFVSSGSDKGGFRSGFAANHIAHRGPPNHPLAGSRHRFFPSFFQRLTRPVALCAPAPKRSFGMCFAGPHREAKTMRLGAANWTMPSTNAAMAVNARSGICFEQRHKAHDACSRIRYCPERARSRSAVFLIRAQNGMSSSMSLLRAPAATARRGAPDGPPDPKSPLESSEPKLPPAPLLRPSSMVRLELNP